MNTNEMSTSTMISRLLDIPEQVICSHSLKELMTAPLAVKGIKEDSVEKLYMLNEISRRWAMEDTEKERIIHGPEDAAMYLKPFFRYKRKEHFAIIVLNIKNHIVNISDISTGSLTASIVAPREVFKEAIRYSAASIILAHNHPSGNTRPSREDIAVTKRLTEVGTVMDIPVLDHIIIGHDAWLSLKEEGLMKDSM